MATKAKKTTTAEKSAVPAFAGRYVEGIGRRKTAVARVRLFKGDGKVYVQDKTLAEYFQVPRLRDTVTAPMTRLKIDSYDVHAHVNGGGLNSQAEAIQLGIARALVDKDGDLKKQLRGLGFMTRDSRAVERKKYGLKKARRAPQWAKR
jgi:small subunit ribosomal protein S9